MKHPQKKKKRYVQESKSGVPSKECVEKYFCICKLFIIHIFDKISQENVQFSINKLKK